MKAATFFLKLFGYASGFFTIIALSGFIIVPLSILNGWILSTIWNWFIPSTFASMPALTVKTAIGFTLVISTIRGPTPYSSNNKNGKEKIEAISQALASPFLILLIAYLFHVYCY